MANFYEELRESRLARGLSIEDISSVTKINPQYLHAIETGEYDLLPEPYIVLFIKAYAKEIGIDPDEAARKYRLFRTVEELPKEKRRARRELAEGEQTLNPESKTQSQSRLLWGGIVAVFVVLLLSVKFCSVEDPSMSSDVIEGTDGTLVLDTDESELIILDSVATKSAAADSANLLSENVSTTVKSMTLRIMSMDSVRVRVVVIPDDGNADDITFQRLGEEQTWNAFDQFSVRISKTRGVAIYLDDQLLPYLGPANTWVSRALINKQGIIEGKTILRVRN